MFQHWRTSLLHFVEWFTERRASTRYFYAKLFLFFISLNFACYWWSLLTTFPNLLSSYKSEEYVLMGFPLAFLGALFDSASLFITLLIARAALRSDRNLKYVALLSVDLIIAALATLWTLLVFVIAGWVVSFVLGRPETMVSRTILYENRLLSAWLDPFNHDNIRHIYFGIIMGASALLPTLAHIYLAGYAFIKAGISNISDAKAPHLMVIRIYRVAFVSGVICLGILSLLPRDAMPVTGISDKIEHFLAYGLLGLIGFRAYLKDAWHVAIGLIFYGLLLEILQSMIPGRDPSLFDAIANTLGVLTSWAVLWGLRKALRREDASPL